MGGGHHGVGMGWKSQKKDRGDPQKAWRGAPKRMERGQGTPGWDGGDHGARTKVTQGDGGDQGDNRVRIKGREGGQWRGGNGVPTFFSRSGVWKVSRNFLTWSLRSWSMLRASMARLRNSSTSSSGLRASWAPRLGHGKGGSRLLVPPPPPGSAPFPKRRALSFGSTYLSLLESSMPWGDTREVRGEHQGHWQGLGGGGSQGW